MSFDGSAALMNVAGKEGGVCRGEKRREIKVALEKTSPWPCCWFPEGINNELKVTLIRRRPYI